MKIDRFDSNENPTVNYKSIAKDIVYSDLNKEQQVQQIITAQREATERDLLYLLETLESEHTENKGGGYRPIDHKINSVKTTMELLGIPVQYRK